MSISVIEATSQLINYFRYQLPQDVWNQYFNDQTNDMHGILKKWHEMKGLDGTLSGDYVLVCSTKEYEQLKQLIIRKIYHQWLIEDVNSVPMLVLLIDLIPDKKKEFLAHPTKFRLSQLATPFPKYVDDFLLSISRKGQTLNVGLNQLILNQQKSNVIPLVSSFFFNKKDEVDTVKFEQGKQVLKQLDQLDEKKDSEK